MHGPSSCRSSGVSSSTFPLGLRARVPGFPSLRRLGPALAALCLSATAVSAAPPKEPVRQYLKGKGSLMCEELYQQLRDAVQTKEPAQAPDARKDPWVWPAWLFMAAKCSSQPARDATWARPGADALFQAGNTDCALVTLLLGSYCHIRASQLADAWELLQDAPTRAQGARSTDRTPAILDLVRQCRAYSEFRWQETRVFDIDSRPGIVIAPFDASRLPSALGRDVDTDATAAAITWLVLEAMGRIVATFPLPDELRPITVEEDLARRFSDGRVCGVNSRFDKPTRAPGRDFDLAAYMTRIRDDGKHFIAGFVSTDQESTRLVVNDLLSGSDFGRGGAAEQNVYVTDGSGGSKSMTLRHFGKVGSLARAAAFDILTRFYNRAQIESKPTKLREDWIPLPNNEDVFWAYVEAVGYESRGNYPMAIRRYREALDLRPAGIPDTQMAFITQRLGRCEALAAFDTPERFFRRNEATLRSIIGEYAR